MPETWRLYMEIEEEEVDFYDKWVKNPKHDTCGAAYTMETLMMFIWVTPFVSFWLTLAFIIVMLICDRLCPPALITREELRQQEMR